MKYISLWVGFWFLLIGGAHAQVTEAGDRPTVVGYFSNTKIYDSEGDPHESGYALELYRQKNIYFGRFFLADGMVGDAPRGIIENIKFTPSNGKFVFSSKLRFGDEHDTYFFTGFLQKNRIYGVLKYQNIMNPQQGLVSKKIVLTKRKDAVIVAPLSLKEWNDQNQL